MKKVLVLPDLHIPVEDKRSLNAVEQYMASCKWDRVVQIGDFMDFSCISSHNANNLRAVEGQSVQADYDSANVVLDRWQKILKGTPIVLLEGNHDFRIERYIDANPQMRGSVEVSKGLNLKSRGIQWVRNWSNGTVYRIGNAVLSHGRYVNDHHAKKMVQSYGENVFYGHTHDVQCYSQVLEGDDRTLVGQSMGCLCAYDQAYMRGAPTKWQQAFATFNFFPDGFFTYYITRIFKHRFVSPEGDVYQG